MAQAILFGAQVSPFVEKVSRALKLKKIGFDLVAPRGPGDLRRWNPQTGKMPVLEINGERVYDSTFILRRLDQLYPEPRLVSEDRPTAAAQRHLEDWADESLYWYLMAIRWSNKHARATAAQISAGAPALLRPLVRTFLRRRVAPTTRAQGLGRLPDEIVLEELAGLLDDLVVLLGDQAFFFGEHPSVADFAIYGMFSMAASGPTPEAAQLIAERSSLLDWMQRVEITTGG
jgi:glutathione S-transferase